MQGRTGREVRRPFLSRLFPSQVVLPGQSFNPVSNGVPGHGRALASKPHQQTKVLRMRTQDSVIAYGYLPLPLVLHHHTSNASTELHFDTSNGPEQEGHDGVFGRKWGSVTMDAGGSTSSTSAEVRDGMFWFRFVSIQTRQCHSLSLVVGGTGG